MWMAACNSNGPKEAAKLLKYAEQQNESLEMWLVRHTAMDHGSPGAIVANDKFPSYFVSSSVPVWDPAMLGVWRLEVGGMVQRPMSFTLDELMQLPRHSQRVNHFCVEGWNAVAEFAGVRMSDIAAVVRPDPQAKCVDFQSFDSAYHESWDMHSVMHPQTMVVYAKDNVPLSPAYGAPARVHSPIKLGYKNTKYLTRIMFMAERNGGYWTDRGYEWFGGT
jgi:DMSO/TMAO reductase YedYZ molybdopterin-dependent catalytic subunit